MDETKGSPNLSQFAARRQTMTFGEIQAATLKASPFYEEPTSNNAEETKEQQHKHKHHHHNHQRQKTENPRKSEALVNKLTMFLPGMQSLPRMYENCVDVPEMAPLVPSLLIKTKKKSMYFQTDLHVLSFTEHLFIRSTYEMMNFFYDTPNRYEVLDSLGHRIYFATETKRFWTRHAAANYRPFNINILDFEGNKVLQFDGEPGCCQGAAEVCVYQKQEYLGTVAQEMNCCSLRYDILDDQQKELYVIHGPTGAACLGTFIKKLTNIEFPIFLPGKSTKVGKCGTNFEGAVVGLLNTPNTFGISFDKSIDVKIKAILLAAAFLIYFEEGGGQPNSRTLFKNGRGYNRFGRLPCLLSCFVPLISLGIVGGILYINKFML